MLLTPTWDAALARVVLAVTAIPGAATSLTITRYVGGSASGTAVRGGDLGGADPGTSATVSDREFTPGAVNLYTARAYAAGVLTSSASGSITPTLMAPWLRSPTRPFLDRPVTVQSIGDVTRPSRAGVFEVLGRRLPVAVTEVRGSRRFDLVLTAATRDERNAIELFTSFGDVLLFQPPAGCDLPGPLYASVGDVAVQRRGAHDTQRRYLILPLTEVSAPDPSIVGSTVTWLGVQSAYATWSAVMAAKPTWLALQETVSNPVDEVVG